MRGTSRSHTLKDPRRTLLPRLPRIPVFALCELSPILSLAAALRDRRLPALSPTPTPGRRSPFVQALIAAHEVALAEARKAADARAAGLDAKLAQRLAAAQADAQHQLDALRQIHAHELHQASDAARQLIAEERLAQLARERTVRDQAAETLLLTERQHAAEVEQLKGAHAAELTHLQQARTPADTFHPSRPATRTRLPASSEQRSSSNYSALCFIGIPVGFPPLPQDALERLHQAEQRHQDELVADRVRLEAALREAKVTQDTLAQRHAEELAAERAAAEQRIHESLDKVCSPLPLSLSLSHSPLPQLPPRSTTTAPAQRPPAAPPIRACLPFSLVAARSG